MTRRPLVLARATKPLHQTRSLHEVVPPRGRARRAHPHQQGLPHLAVRRRVGRAAATPAAARHPAGRPATQAPAAPHRRCDPLRERVRVQAGRRPTPTAAIVDSQSVRAADTVSKASRGWDAGKKVNGRKRHLAVDTLGLLLVVSVTAASVQDRDAARGLLWRLRASYRGIRLCWADAGYAGKLVAWAGCMLRLVVEIVRKRPGQSTFEVLPRRWVVERTFAWISKHRRCVRDYERLPAHHAAMVTWAMVAVMTRRLARPHRPPSIQTNVA